MRCPPASGPHRGPSEAQVGFPPENTDFEQQKVFLVWSPGGLSYAAPFSPQRTHGTAPHLHRGPGLASLASPAWGRPGTWTGGEGPLQGHWENRTRTSVKARSKGRGNGGAGMMRLVRQQVLGPPRAQCCGHWLVQHRVGGGGACALHRHTEPGRRAGEEGGRGGTPEPSAHCPGEEEGWRRALQAGSHTWAGRV